MADIIIVGAGPAGLSAAIYARRAGMDTVLYEGETLAMGYLSTTIDHNGLLSLLTLIYDSLFP